MVSVLVSNAVDSGFEIYNEERNFTTNIYISHLVQNSRACVSYHDFLDRRLLLTWKLLNRGFVVVVNLKSSP